MINMHMVKGWHIEKASSSCRMVNTKTSQTQKKSVWGLQFIVVICTKLSEAIVSRINYSRK
jgi:hypothetical protein